MSSGDQIKSLGVLTFSEEGVLFAGDSVAGAVHAIDLTSERKAATDFEINVYRIDSQIADVLGTTQNSIQLVDLAVHPESGEVYISGTRGHGSDALPFLVKVDTDSKVLNIDLASLDFTTQELHNLPDHNRRVALRGTGSSPTIKEIAKSKLPLRMLSVVAMEYYRGELFVAGINNEEFCSVLRRMSYPFNGTESISNIEMFHIVHDQYESRAPIRTMAVKNIDGKDQMIAAYTCSPLVLIPLDETKDNTKVKARTIGDMGNGQPIDMVPFQANGQEMLFVTNNSRSPLVIPINDLQNAKVVTDKDFERGAKLDLNPLMPYGPIGKTIMFSGASLRIDLLNKGQFISLNRDAESGSLDLETVATMFPFKMHNIIGDRDIPKQ